MALLFSYIEPLPLPNNNNDDNNDNNKPDNYYFLYTQDLYENANSLQLNESKLYGTVAKYLTLGFIVVVYEPNKYITKKGANNLIGNVKRRTPNNLIIGCIVNDQVPCHEFYTKYVTDITTFTKDNNLSNSNHVPTTNDSNKYTTGIIGTFAFNDNNKVTGHITTSYNITTDEENRQDAAINKIIQECSIVPGYIIRIQTSKDGVTYVNGGSVVYIPDLKPMLASLGIDVLAPHITNGTTIKAALSTQIILKNLAKEYDFMLTDIDPSTKQKLHIRIINDSNTRPNASSDTDRVTVELEEYYSYLLEYKN